MKVISSPDNDKEVELDHCFNEFQYEKLNISDNWKCETCN